MSAIKGRPVNGTISVPVPSGDKLGPCMAQLNENQRAFVVGWFHFGDKHKAAEAAGYSTINYNTLCQGVYKLWHNPKVQAAIQEYARTQMSSLVPGALAVYEEILRDPGHKDHAKVATEIFNRTGFHAMTEVLRTDRVDPNDRMAQIERITKLAQKLGIDPKSLLGTAADVIEGDFKVAEDVSAERSDAGLEDLL